jgi:hypothetical protein
MSTLRAGFMIGLALGVVVIGGERMKSSPPDRALSQKLAELEQRQRDLQEQQESLRAQQEQLAALSLRTGSAR